MTKKNILLILVTAVLTVFLTIAGFSLFGQTPNFGSTVLDGHYIVEGIDRIDGVEAPTLSIEGDDVVIDYKGASILGTIDKATKTITTIDNGKEDRVTYKMIAGKLVLTPKKGDVITFVKQSAKTKKTTSISKNKTDTADGKEKSQESKKATSISKNKSDTANSKGKSQESKKATSISKNKTDSANNKGKSQESKAEITKDSSSSNKDLTVDIVKDKAKETIGLIPEQAYDLLNDLEYYEYEDSEVSINIDFEDESGDYISSFDDNYKVKQVLNVVKTSDDYITVTFIVEPK